MSMKLPFLFVAALYALTPRPVMVNVRPAFAMEPGGFHVYAMIEKHADNRQLVLEAVLWETFHVRRTPFQVDGAQSQRVFRPTNRCLCWDDLAAGDYEAVATLTRITDGRTQVFVDRQPFRVLGADPPSVGW